MQENQYNPQLKLITYLDRIYDWRKGKEIFPISVEVSPSLLCNSYCPWCFYKEKVHITSNEFIDTGILINVLKELKGLGVEAINFTGEGEPTLHPDFDKIVEAAYKAGLELGLFTNGTIEVRNPEYFTWIRISITGAFQLNRRIIKNYVRATDVGVCINYCKYSGPHTERLCKEAKSLGVNHFQIRPALTRPKTKQIEYFPPLDLTKYETDNFKVIFPEYKWAGYVKPRNYDKCYGHYFCPAITHEGNVNVCMYHLGDKNFIFGNIYRDPFKKIWRANRRKKVIKNLKLNNCQTCCKNHEINRLLYVIKHPAIIKHRQFL